MCMQAEGTQKYAQEKYEKITSTAKVELADFNARRVPYFRKNLVSLADLQYKHAKVRLPLFAFLCSSIQRLDGCSIVMTACSCPFSVYS